MRLLVLACIFVAGCDGQLRFEADRDSSVDASPVADVRPDSPRPPCKADSDCPFASLHCDVATATCVPCLIDAQCTAHSETPRCNTDTHTCVECNRDADCGTGGRCDASRCLQACGGGMECGGETPSCNPTRNVCTCTTSSCTSSERPRCDATVGICVACAGDGDCSGENHRCVRGECVPCTVDADCPGKRCDPIRNECID